MPVKRSRVRRSPSFVDTGVLAQVPTPVVVALPEHRWDKRSATQINSGKVLKPSEMAGKLQVRPRILMVASPETASGTVDVRDEKPIGAFLEKCYYCNGKIHENVEVFMYGYLQWLWNTLSFYGRSTVLLAAATASAKPSELVVDHQSQPKILTVASPETDKRKFDERFEGIQKCYRCKKICKNDAVFMYGYLRAFCTSECRDRQMMFDKELEKKASAEQPMEAMNEHQCRVNGMKNEFGFQAEKKAAP